MKKSILTFLFLRYLILVILAVAFFSGDLIYNFLLKLTIIPSNLILNLFFNSITNHNFILMGNISIELIPACIGISAYFLLFSLNLLTPISPKKRFYSLLTSGVALLLFNIMRITIISSLYIKQIPYADLIHLSFWYFFNLLFILILWFGITKLFKIKTIPVYSDFKTILRLYKK